MQKMQEIAATVWSLAGHPFRKMIIPLSLMKNKCWGIYNVRLSGFSTIFANVFRKAAKSAP